MKTKQITFHNKDGSTYQGTWKDGKEHGYGIGKGDGCTYEGEWKNGLPHGEGKLIDDEGTITEGDFIEGILTEGIMELDDGSMYGGGFNEKAGFRMVPNSPVRKGSFVGKNAVLMPCYVNIGAYIGAGTMMDTFSRAGSCCQIGKNCHISAGSGIGGVLEPAQALPTIIEDNVFVGAMSEVVEGVIVGEGSVLSMGMYIGQSTKIVNRKTGEIVFGKIPPYSVVVPGSLPDKNNPLLPSLYCAVIIKQVDEKTRSKTSVNDLLRD